MEIAKSHALAAHEAGIMPLKPRPNTAETMKSPASLWVARKPTMATKLPNPPARWFERPRRQAWRRWDAKPIRKAFLTRDNQ